MQLIPAHRRKVEEAIHAAEHPKGMSVHDGMARIDASILRRLLAIVDSITVPEGWKMVPVEPTRQMIDAARQHHEGEAYLPFSLYRAMLAAAPKPGDSNE